MGSQFVKQHQKMKEIRLYKSPWKVIRMILLCSPFVAMGVFILTLADSPKWVGWLNILFFGLSYPIGLYQLLDRRPLVIINEIGLFDRRISNKYINWDIITDAYSAEVHKQKFICLVVKEEFEPSKTKGKWVRKKAAAFSKALGFQELNIALGVISIDEVKLTQFILAMISAEKTQREEMITKRWLTQARSRFRT